MISGASLLLYVLFFEGRGLVFFLEREEQEISIYWIF